MKKRNIASLATSVAMLSTSLCGANVFAANPYGINYTGGSPLSASNVQIEPELIDELTPLISFSGSTITTSSSSDRWEEGYYKEGERCLQAKYVAVTADNLVDSSDGLSISYAYNQYTIVSNIKQVVLEGINDNSRVFFLGVTPGRTTIFGGMAIYEDSACSTPADGQSYLSAKDGERMFIETDIKLYRQGRSSVFAANGLYFGISDIDARQSFKILNDDNMLIQDNMFAKNEEGLQSPDTTLRNMFEPGGNYIYSQYDADSGEGITINDTSNVYVELSKETQEEGLNMVFGYAGNAGSAIGFYAKQFLVTYDSDSHGIITGITEENVIAGENPLGTTETPEEEYVFSTWIADADVTLDDGTTIESGSNITYEQLQRVIVDSNINFTALHVYYEDADTSDIVVPNTGASTGEINAIIVPVSVIGILLGALFIRFLPRLAHKKVNFDK